MAVTTTTTRGRRSPMSLGIAAGLVLIASLFFWLSAFSTPYIDDIYYLRWESNVGRTYFGNFGLAFQPWGRERLDSKSHVGYAYHPWIVGDDNLTGSLILVALTAGFGSLAFLSLLHSISDLRSGFCAFFLTLFTAILATLSFFPVVICWGVAHHRLGENDLSPHYGAAFPLVIVGWLMFLAAIPLVIIGWFRERHYRQETTTTTTTRRRWF